MQRMKGKIAAAGAMLAAVLAFLWLYKTQAPDAEPAANSCGVVKVASLHPLLSELAERVGGEAVQVVDLFPAAADLHSFTPTGAEVAAAAGSKLLLACGRGVEPYLRGLRDTLPGVYLLELGESMPEALLPDGHTPDPHWWNTPENMKRAAQALAEALVQVAPEKQEDIEARRRAYAQEMDELTRWAKLKLARIPAPNRVLVTEHAALCHFCAAFHFSPIAVQGVAQESEGDTAQLARLLAELREKRVACIFSDAMDSPRFLENIAAQIGAAIRPLYMDGTHPAGEKMSYRDIFTHNVNAIYEGLKPEPRADEP